MAALKEIEQRFEALEASAIECAVFITERGLPSGQLFPGLDNPAIIHVGDSYADLGATITAPQVDLNLSTKTFPNGTLVSNIVIDTSQVATDTIDYVAPTAGSTARTTRTVIIEPVIAATSSAQ